MKFLRRWYHARRVAHWGHEIAHLERIAAAVGPQLDQAIRKFTEARMTLAFVDIARPPVSHAQGRPANDGVRRAISVEAEAQANAKEARAKVSQITKKARSA